MSNKTKSRIHRLERLLIGSLHRAEQRMIGAVTRTESVVERVFATITGEARA